MAMRRSLAVSPGSAALLLALAACSLVLLTPVSAVLAQPAEGAGQESPEASRPKLSPLGVRQQRVERMMEDLDRKFKSLAQTLEKSEPERAKRLVDTLQQSKQLLIQQRMAQIVAMLNEARLDQATAEQKQILADLRLLIQMLLDETDDKEKLRQELERLERWKEEINRLLEEEYPQRRESDKIANKDKTMRDIDGQIKAVEELIKKQEQVIAHTEAARSEGVQKLIQVADEQRAVREETTELAEQLARQLRPESPASAEGQPQNGEPSEEKPGAGNDAQGKPGEGQDGAGKEGPAKDGDVKEGEAQDGQPKEGEAKGGKEGQSGSGQSGSGEGKEGAGGEGKGKPGQGGSSGQSQSAGQSQSGAESASSPSPSGPAEPGQRPLERAAGHQRQAESSLQDGKGKAAEGDEKQALSELQKALDELKRERRRVESLPPEAFDELAKRQEQTSQRAAKLAEEMQKEAEKAEAGGKSGQGGEGGEGGGKSGQKSPGKDRVQQAQKSMQRASGDLRKQAAADASRQQDEAIKQLEKALQEIEERLKQLREETQEERLARLEARFREMLARQQEASQATLALEKKRLQGALRRTDRLTLAKQAKEERALAEMAQQALDILLEDGGSVVFPHVVSQLRDDLNRAGELLDAQKTDGYTQLVQQEIESTLEELIEALQKLQQDRKGGGGGGGGGGNEPLLPNSAELKLLRAAQLRVNRRTAGFDRLRPEGPLDEVMTKEIVDISQRQADVAALTQQVLERVAWPPQ